MSKPLMEGYVDPNDVLSPGEYVGIENLLPKGAMPAQKKTPLPMPYFRGYDYAYPLSDEERKRGGQIWREVGADAVMAPSQFVAGLADIGNEVAGIAGAKGATDERMSLAVSALRNQLAGRPGVAPGKLTGIVQGLATTPFAGAGGFTRSMLYGAGIGGGLAAEEESPLWEGAKTAAVSGALSGIGRALGPSTPKSEAEKAIRATAKKEDIGMLAGTEFNQPLLKELERRSERNVLLGGVFSKNYATSIREGIDDSFAKALWKRVGKNYDEFTPKYIDDTFKEIGRKLDLPFKGKTIVFRSPTLSLAARQATQKANNITEPTFLNKATEVVTKRINKGDITASDMNVMMADLRYLTRKAYDDGNKEAGDAIGELVRAVRSQAIANIPTQTGKEAYKRALNEYANMHVITDVFTKSKESARGNIDYSKLKSAVESSMPFGYSRGRADLADLAGLGEAMSKGGVLPEGVKFGPIDPTIYMMLNNPLARYLRSNSPIPSEPISALLRGSGVQATMPPEE